MHNAHYEHIDRCVLMTIGAVASEVGGGTKGHDARLTGICPRKVDAQDDAE